MDSNDIIDQFREFIPFCARHLGLERLPKITWFVAGGDGAPQSTFGDFHTADGAIRVGISNRHPLDIMRTLAHEMVHYRQWLDGRTRDLSGETGSPEENEANARAGIIMRDWGRSHPRAFDQEPITESERAPTVIKLRGFSGGGDERSARMAKARAWIERIEAKLRPNPLNPHQLVMPFDADGEHALAIIELVPSPTMPGAVEIKWIKAHPERAGIGRRAMEKLQAWAAEDGIALVLYPWDRGSLSQAQLTDFYGRLGFKPAAPGSRDLVWTPAAAINENSTGYVDRVLDDLRNHPGHIDSAVDQIVYIVLRYPQATQRYRSTLISAVDQRKSEILRYLLGLLANPQISQENALYIVSPAVRGLKMLGMPWPELDVIRRSIDSLGSKQLDESKLSHKDPVERWIAVFKASTHPRFRGKTPEQRERMARAAQYRAVQDKKMTEAHPLDRLTPTPAQLAARYGVSERKVEEQLARGIRVEMEHTTDPKIAREIALDHLGEDLRYYEKLAGIEKPATGATLGENFADGKGPGRPGDSQRLGIPKGATIAQLEKHAKRPGRAGQLARWQLNMRRGRAKR